MGNVMSMADAGIAATLSTDNAQHGLLLDSLFGANDRDLAARRVRGKALSLGPSCFLPVLIHSNP